MKLNSQAAQWLSRYERVFARRLPLKTKRDILNEFHSHILDDLEERYSDDEVDEELMKEYLQGLGSPRCKASSYMDESFLISSELYPFFRMVAGIVLLVLALVMIVTGAIEMGTDGFTGVLILKKMGDLFSGLTSTLGSLVLVFFVLGKVLPRENWTDPFDDEIWSVDLLPENEYPLIVKKGDAIGEIVCCFLALVVFSFFRNLVGIHSFSGGVHTFIPVLALPFWKLLPLLMLNWILTILVNLILLRAGRWSLPLRLGDLALRALGLGIMIVYFRIGFDALFLVDNATGDGMVQFVKVMRILYPILLGLGIFGSIVEIVKKTIALYREPVEAS